MELTAHTAPVISVDYSHSQAGVLATGSHDKTVRLWDVRDPHTHRTIISPDSVCSVRFNPSEEEHTLLFGSANAVTYYYDIRNLDMPVSVFSEHTGAVCAVAFHLHNEFVTQSVDNTIKLWNTSNPSQSVRTYQG